MAENKETISNQSYKSAFDKTDAPKPLNCKKKYENLLKEEQKILKF